ncbi:hypothetical protein OIO90_001188 [Microbotryomycetes sp. JL221]|nr:hypothetical protein OIO90_001188 [Microbotryomycetes sp. JL221]
MASLTFDSVLCMKRSELQTICKEIPGVKANAKNDDMRLAITRHYNLAPQAQATAEEHKPAAPKTPRATKSTKSAKKQSKQAQPATDQPERDEMRLGSNLTQPLEQSDNTPPLASTTSPGTKRTIAQLIKSVQTLQTELAQARSKLAQVESSARSAGPAMASPGLKQLEVHQIVDEAVDVVRQELSKRWQQETLTRLDALEQRVMQDDKRDEQHRLKVTQEQDGVTQWRQLVEQRLVAIEQQVKNSASATTTTNVPAVSENVPASSTRVQAITSEVAVRQPCPALSDAPPVESLLNDSPSLPHTHVRAFTAAHAVVSERATLATAGPGSTRKRPVTETVASLALPRHMAAYVSPVKATSTVEQVRPASSEPSATRTIGKHARDSDASELSVNVETVENSQAINDLVVSPTKSSGGHSRKRLRISSVSVFEDEENQDHNDKSTDEAESNYETTTEMLSTTTNGHNENIFTYDSGDYVVKTKMGDDEDDENEHSRSRSGSAVKSRSSIADPTFFSTGTMMSTTPGRSSNGGPRKSLPLSSLPFPLVSPFATSRSVNNDEHDLTKTPGSVSRKSSFGPMTTFGSSKRKSMLNSASSKKQRRCRSLAPAPATPPAYRTLYGTERGFQDNSNNQVETDEDDIFGNKSRAHNMFQEFGEAPVSVRKSMTWGGGLFGNIEL